MVRVISELSESEYRLVRTLRALGEEKRFLIFKNLRTGPCYAGGLTNALKISRAALEKHVRRLIQAKLVKKKLLIEGGRTKAIFELTDFARSIAEEIEGIIIDIGEVEARLVDELKEGLTEVTAQMESIVVIMRGLEDRLRNGEISPEDYDRLKSRYERQRSELRSKADRLRKKLKGGRTLEDS